MPQNTNSQEVQLATILRRLDEVELRSCRSERTVRLWKVAAGCLLGICLLTLTVKPGHAVSDTVEANVVRAKEIVLIDGAGKERALLRTFPNGGANLVIRSNVGKAGVSLGEYGNNGMGALTFDDTEGHNRVMLVNDPTDTGSFLDLLDGSHNPHARLAMDTRGNASLLVETAKGRQRNIAP